MDRYEVPASGEFEPMIEALERGDEVVLVRDGKAIAAVTRVGENPEPRPMTAAERDEMFAIWDSLPGPSIDATRLIREMRDEGY